MSNEFSGDYHPAGSTTRYKRRRIAQRNGRKGGLVSGKRRRELARGRRPARRRTRQEALSLNYRHRQLSRQAFERRYFKTYPTGNLRGMETLWQHYQGRFTVYRCEGQHYRTTNEQCSTALEKRGRARCRRQVQRLNRRLEEMGLAVVSHYKDQRTRPGHKDCLVVEIRTPRDKNVTPPLRGSGNPPKGREVPTTAPARKVEDQRRDKDSIPPPTAADAQGRHSAPDRPVTEEEKLEGRIRFAEMKLEAGFATGPARAQLRYLEGELRRLRQAREPSAFDRARPVG